MKIDLIELADYASPDAIADEIFRQNPEIIAKVPIEEIAELVGINDVIYKDLDNLEGALVANRNKTKGKIIINRPLIGGNKQRQRYTFGHELGHFLLPFHGYEMSCSIGDLKIHNTSNQHLKVELEANKFSSQILMPKKAFMRNQFFDAEPSINNIEKLSEIFDVSMEACTNRFADLHHDPLAIIFSKDNRYRYFNTSDNHPFYFYDTPRKEKLLPLMTLTSQINTNVPDKIYQDSVDSSLWFKECKDFQLPDEVIEETLVQNNGYAVTLLWFEEQLEEIEC